MNRRTMREEIEMADRKYKTSVLGIIGRMNDGSYPNISAGFDDQERARQNHIREIMDIHRRYAADRDSVALA